MIQFSQITYRVEMKYKDCIALSAGYTATLYVMVIRWKGVAVHLPPLPAMVDFPSWGDERHNSEIAILCVLCRYDDNLWFYLNEISALWAYI